MVATERDPVLYSGVWTAHHRHIHKKFKVTVLEAPGAATKSLRKSCNLAPTWPQTGRGDAGDYWLGESEKRKILIALVGPLTVPHFAPVGRAMVMGPRICVCSNLTNLTVHPATVFKAMSWSLGLFWNPEPLIVMMTYYHHPRREILVDLWQRTLSVDYSRCLIPQPEINCPPGTGDSRWTGHGRYKFVRRQINNAWPYFGKKKFTNCPLA